MSILTNRSMFVAVIVTVSLAMLGGGSAQDFRKKNTGKGKEFTQCEKDHAACLVRCDYLFGKDTTRLPVCISQCGQQHACPTPKAGSVRPSGTQAPASVGAVQTYQSTRPQSR